LRHIVNITLWWHRGDFLRFASSKKKRQRDIFKHLRRNPYNQANSIIGLLATMVIRYNLWLIELCYDSFYDWLQVAKMFKLDAAAVLLFTIRLKSNHNHVYSPYITLITFLLDILPWNKTWIDAGSGDSGLDAKKWK